MKNIIQFRNGFVNLPNDSQNNHSMALTITAELMQFGYLLDQNAINNIKSSNSINIVNFHNEVITWLKKMTGSERTYRPFWSGFPEEVMEKTEEELWTSQIIHYISFGSYLPNEWSKMRPTAFEQPNYTILKAGDDTLFDAIFTDLVSVNQSLTRDDLETVKWFVESGRDLILPNTIPFKETLCTLAMMGVKVPVKTTTDVLRIAVGMSGGDISLPKVPSKTIKINAWVKLVKDNPNRKFFKFKKFTRKERRFILELLESTNCDPSEAVLKDQRWIRLGEILHPGEYRNKYPKSFNMFNRIRNEKVTSWYGKVDQSFRNSFVEGLEKLSERPGEFLRKLDSLIRNDEKQANVVLDKFKDIAPLVSNKVLYEAHSYFLTRNKVNKNRKITIKGKRTSVKLPDLPKISQNTLDLVSDTILKSLGDKFASLPPLGNVWIDSELSKIPLPSNMRSLNPALKPKIRGTRVPMGNQNAKTIRAFVHWFDEMGSEDLDLSATFIGMGKSPKIISWNCGHSEEEGYFSGDIRHVQGACAEYIDINIEKSLKNGYKYVVLDVRNFQGYPLSEVKDCVFGWMEREYPVANEIFKPSTLANTVRLDSPSQTTIVAIIDVETQEYIFLDIDQNGLPVANMNTEDILEKIKEYSELSKFSTYNILKMHADRRGKLVSNKEDADIIFTYEDFTNSYVNILKYMGI
jgi:hypothetical protein